MASTRFCATGGYAVCHPRCGKHWCPNPSFASLTSSLPFAALHARSGPLPLMKPRAATGLDTNAPPPLVAGNEMRKSGPKRVNHCPGTARRCHRCRWEGETLQVRWRNVVGLRFRLHLRRESATGAKKRRRSELFFRPATLWVVTCDVLGCDLRQSGPSPATFWAITCDSRGHHLRHLQPLGLGFVPDGVHLCQGEVTEGEPFAESLLFKICETAAEFL